MNVKDIARMSEADARALLRQIRWADNDGRPVCPRCSCTLAYAFKARPIFKCRVCRHQFSETSGTSFAAPKIQVRDYLLMVALFASSAKGISALQLARQATVDFRTAFLFLRKLREAMHQEQRRIRLSGEIEVDGAFFGGHIVQENTVRPGRFKRLARRYTGNRRVVVVARQRGGRTLTFVGKKESEAIFALNAHILPGAVVHCDQAHAWDSLKELFTLMRINHRVAFAAEGACTNNAESFFSVLRRCQLGVHHHISGAYLHLYAAEIAWKQDHRHLSVSQKFLALAHCLLAHRGERRAVAAKPTIEIALPTRRAA